MVEVVVVTAGASAPASVEVVVAAAAAAASEALGDVGDFLAGISLISFFELVCYIGMHVT